ncbi:hypothetical protein [Dongia sp.]
MSDRQDESINSIVGVINSVIFSKRGLIIMAVFGVLGALINALVSR